MCNLKVNLLDPARGADCQEEDYTGPDTGRCFGCLPIDVSILKRGEGLSNGLNRLKELQRNVIPATGAEDPHYLGKLEEARGVARLTEVYLKSALARKESRGGHFRADYPERDDAHGISWIIVQKRSGEMVVDRGKLPLAQYSIAPTHFYMDNSDFSKTQVYGADRLEA